jgi:hypothetical protein
MPDAETVQAETDAIAVAEDNRRAALVFISVGSDTKHVLNGFWEPLDMLRRRHCRVVYVNTKHPNRCIEHYGGRWVLKTRKCIGQNECYAHVQGGFAFEHCCSLEWSVQFETIQVTMLTGDEAMHEVC